MNDWPHLHDLWQRCTGHADANGNQGLARDHRDIKALYARGISMEDAMQFLFQQRPSLEAFQAWLAGRTRVRPAHAASAHQDVLSAAELRHFEEHGYLVLRGAVPRTQCLAAQTAIWDYLGASPHDAASWYQPHPGKRGLMLQFSDHPALEENRHSTHIRHAFQQLYGTGTGIYASIDKVSFNPPETPQHRFLGSALHWDVSLQQPVPFKLQGMLYLSDCPAQHGAFHCVPGFQHRMAGWLEQVPPGRQPREWAIDNLRPVPVDGMAGDFIIWHQALPHCATPNRGPAPRMVQYLTYLPDHCQDQDVWI
ncbi:Phytanoyl-CoA dioxygenase (PhyH) [Janthinobacterium sp. KBS0711]|uniref:phytanoyl-CoA dioxygenase family protein n=1 Tax=Janthinobacterium sp. KBS0711 TaxID=1649647 RepID=UPI000627AEBF|nr:phytanoyl-CoA dioxygenase family protein [Janthinobacterium sp. KBS0711]KKO65073.1 Phytanoyl-CoA dioxygenase (PhyH) [Janthinobacterium sp. KBS0711]TSD71053.1 phytanoyl-CoA dioxygenase family protein [Janthinobacterium sp. KBS0711]